MIVSVRLYKWSDNLHLLALLDAWHVTNGKTDKAHSISYRVVYSQQIFSNLSKYRNRYLIGDHVLII
jgi:hypothetical protein